MGIRQASARTFTTLVVAAVLSLILSVLLHVTLGPKVALGFAGGVLVGAGMLSALVFVLNRALKPDDRPGAPPVLLLILHTGKFIVAAAAAYVIVKLWRGDPFAFAGGYTVALAVLIIIAGGAPSSVKLPKEEDDETAR